MRPLYAQGEFDSGRRHIARGVQTTRPYPKSFPDPARTHVAALYYSVERWTAVYCGILGPAGTLAAVPSIAAQPAEVRRGAAYPQTLPAAILSELSVAMRCDAIRYDTHNANHWRSAVYSTLALQIQQVYFNRSLHEATHLR